jgi:nicotinamide-nucleotide amidase
MPSKGDAQWIVAELARRGETLASAESLTGGLVAARIVDVPGASEVFAGGVVSYQSEVKTHVLGVDQMELRTLGAVSEGVAIQMATGVRAALLPGRDVTWAIATTGVAGPEPDPVGNQPAGIVLIAVCGPNGFVATEKLGFVGEARNQIRHHTVDFALGLLERVLRGVEKGLAGIGGE